MKERLPYSLFITVEEDIERKPYNIIQLCEIYQVSRWTMNNWLKHFAHRIGIKKGQYFSKEQVEIIFKCIGVPFRVVKKEAVWNNPMFRKENYYLSTTWI